MKIKFINKKIVCMIHVQIISKKTVVLITKAISLKMKMEKQIKRLKFLRDQIYLNLMNILIEQQKVYTTNNFSIMILLMKLILTTDNLNKNYKLFWDWLIKLIKSKMKMQKKFELPWEL